MKEFPPFRKHIEKNILIITLSTAASQKQDVTSVLHLLFLS